MQSNGMTPLMYAVKESKTTFLERFIDLGSDVTVRNTVSTEYCKNNDTALIQRTTVVLLYYYTKRIQKIVFNSIRLAKTKQTNARERVLKLIYL